MANVTARIKIKGKNFEVLVDCDKALAFKKGQGDIRNVISADGVFFDLRKPMTPTEKELIEHFKTKDLLAVASKIVKEGEIMLPAEYKSKARDEKVKQIIDFISKSCSDAKGMPHTPDRIKKAMDEAHVVVDDRKKADEQIPEIIKKLQAVIPLKFESKKIHVQVSSVHASKVYGLLKEYAEKEDWLSDGSLSCLLNIPVGALMNFFDRLNAVTHGEAITKEIKA